MSSRSQTARKSIETYKVRLSDLYNKAQQKQLTQGEVITLSSTALIDLHKLPQWAVCEVIGYKQGMSDAFDKGLEDRWELDGQQFTKEESLKAILKGRWSEVKYLGKFYPGTDKQYS